MSGAGGVAGGAVIGEVIAGFGDCQGRCFHWVLEIAGTGFGCKAAGVAGE